MNVDHDDCDTMTANAQRKKIRTFSLRELVLAIVILSLALALLNSLFVRHKPVSTVFTGLGDALNSSPSNGVHVWTTWELRHHAIWHSEGTVENMFELELRGHRCSAVYAWLSDALMPSLTEFAQRSGARVRWPPPERSHRGEPQAYIMFYDINGRRGLISIFVSETPYGSTVVSVYASESDAPKIITGFGRKWTDR